MSIMREVQVGDLTARHVGQRVYVTEEGAVVTGRLDQIWASTDHKGETHVTVFEVVTDAGAEFKLARIPLDYLVQIEDESEPPVSESTEP